MTTGYQVNGVDLAQIFSAKGSHTAETTGIQVNGTDLNQILLALADGSAIGYATGIEVNGTDLNAIFGVTSGALPIQGEEFVALPTQAGGVSTASMSFNCSTSGWSITGSQSNTSGSLPSGAAKLQVTPTYESGSTNSTITNAFGGMTALTSSSEACNIHLASSQSDPINATYSLLIVFQNSAGSTISTTTCTFYMDTAGT